MTTSQRERNMGTLVALLFLVAMAIGLIFLVALVMPQVLGFVVVGAGFFLFCAFHYLVWGWWFRPRMIEDEDASA